MALTPHELSGQALGLQSAGMLTMQGVGALAAGVLAQWSSPSAAMTATAALSVVVTLSLARGLRPESETVEALRTDTHSRRMSSDHFDDELFTDPSPVNT